MKNRNLWVITGILTFACLFGAGCGNEIPDMDIDQENKLTQFATDILLPKTRSRLVDTEKEGILRAEKARKNAEIQAKIKQMKSADVSTQEEGNDASVENLAGDSPSTQQEVIYSVSDVPSILGLDGFEMTYNGFEIVDQYVDQIGDSSDWMPTVEASKGYHLVVVKLGLTNRTEGELTANLAAQPYSYRISTITNGNKKVGASLMTLLLSDFTILKETFGPGQYGEYVVITQVPDSVTSAESVSLVIKKDGESYHVLLQ